MNFTRIFSLCIAFCFLTSCNFNRDQLQQNVVAEGYLIWTGEYSNDGCGFLIEIGSMKYKPENESVIDDKYKTSSRVPVELEFIGLNRIFELSCGESNEIEVIEIISMNEIVDEE
ncbi:hypothetical protein [Ancylomarina sp.]|uniref:hypothetical protein n=1 Tax=Ancylomarina sp. TaxID=1970196 RepID=UPI00356394F2